MLTGNVKHLSDPNYDIFEGQMSHLYVSCVKSSTPLYMTMKMWHMPVKAIKPHNNNSNNKNNNNTSTIFIVLSS